MTTKALQVATQAPSRAVSDLVRRSEGILSRQRLLAENAAYAGTGGVSGENRHNGFAPAYLDTWTGIALPSRYADGAPAPIHVLDGLPPHWVVERDPCGRVLKTRPGIVAGFLCNGCFYTRDQAAALTVH
jgi:hypothetical protein